MTKKPIKKIKFGFISSDKMIVDLVNLLKDGGCVAIICNTVRDAQLMRWRLRKIFQKDDIILLHALFTASQRRKIEEKCANYFGKDKSNRPHIKILISTQITEQSLDLDFDLMFSFISPVDFLLQRMGRLHRFGDTIRPNLLSDPIFYIILDFNGKNPKFGLTSYVYSPYVLLKTYLILKDKTEISFSEIENFVNSLYCDEIDFGDEWNKILDKCKNGRYKEIHNKTSKAKSLIIPSPTDFNLEIMENLDIHQLESPEKILCAATRHGSPSVELILLYSDENGCLYFDRKRTKKVDLNHIPTSFEIKCMMENSFSVSWKKVYEHFEKISCPSTWEETPLRKYKLLVIGTNGCYNCSDIMLRYSDSYGLRRVKKNEL